MRAKIGLALLGVLVLAPPAGAAVPRTLLATVDGAGTTIPGGATDVAMTPDGRYVAFVTAQPLDPSDANGTGDVYRRDRRTGQVVRISVPDPAAPDAAVERSSSHPSLSADGRLVAFESLSERLDGADVNGGSDVYVRDVAAGTTRRVSVRLDGTVAGPATTNLDDAMQPQLSADGSTVTWLAPEFTVSSVPSNAWHVWARRLDRATAERVDAAPGGAPSNADVANDRLSISGDGRLIAFASGATDLVPNDTNNHVDVFVRDRQLGTTQRASVSSSGGQTTGADSYHPSLAQDGSVVAFDSIATNLVAGNDTGSDADVFVRDLRFGQTSRASVTANGSEAEFGGGNPVVSPTGRYVAYQTISRLALDDTTTNSDVYLYDRDTGGVARMSLGGPSTNAGAPRAVGPTGRHVLFDAFDPYISADTNGATDGYLRDTGIDAPPAAAPTVTVRPGDLTIDVDGGASSDPDGWIESYTWSFGDGTTATGPRGPHRYAQAGRYSVVLTVADDDGTTATAVTAIDVTGPPPGPGTPPGTNPGGPAPGTGGGPNPGTGPGGTAKPRAPRNLKRPAITRDRRHARRLTCSPGRWEGKPRLAYRWLRDRRPIARATRRTYTIKNADRGHRLACRVTATIAGRPPGTATSAARAIAPTPKRKAVR